MPAILLVGVDPDVGEGSDVFREPDEESDEAEAEQQGHAAVLLVGAVVDPRGAEEDRYEEEEQVADVGKVVMGEEVRVDENRQE